MWLLCRQKLGGQTPHTSIVSYVSGRAAARVNCKLHLFTSLHTILVLSRAHATWLDAPIRTTHKRKTQRGHDHGIEAKDSRRRHDASVQDATDAQRTPRSPPRDHVRGRAGDGPATSNIVQLTLTRPLTPTTPRTRQLPRFRVDMRAWTCARSPLCNAVVHFC